MTRADWKQTGIWQTMTVIEIPDDQAAALPAAGGDQIVVSSISLAEESLQAQTARDGSETLACVP
jgi:hypothetical protein